MTVTRCRLNSVHVKAIPNNLQYYYYKNRIMLMDKNVCIQHQTQAHGSHTMESTLANESPENICDFTQPGIFIHSPYPPLCGLAKV